MNFDDITVDMQVETQIGRVGTVTALIPRHFSTREEPYPRSRDRVIVKFTDQGVKLLKCSPSGLEKVV